MKAPFYEAGGVYFVTLTVVGWIDIFIRSEYRNEIIYNLHFCQQNKGLRIYGFCLMTNHLHMIASSANGLLNTLLTQFKSFTAKQLIHMNPVRAGLVLRPEDWLHSSSSSDCPLEIFRGDLIITEVG